MFWFLVLLVILLAVLIFLLTRPKNLPKKHKPVPEDDEDFWEPLSKEEEREALKLLREATSPSPSKGHKKEPRRKPSRFKVLNDPAERKWSRELAEGIRGIGRGELICRKALEDIFQVPFPTVRPDWLRSPLTHKNLEIDCFGMTREGPVAVEYSGRQHYEFPNAFHKTQEEFLAQVRRDVYKKKVTQEYDIPFLVVPWNVPYEEIGIFILDWTRGEELL